MSANPFQLFLGVPTSDPRALLGLGSHRNVGVDEVDRALRLRLAQTFQHPHGRSPEADYVRNELRKAAEVLKQSAASAPTSAPATAAKGELPPWLQARRPHSTPPPIFNLTQFDRLVLAVLVGSGGWNPTSRARLVSLAAAHGITVLGLMRVVQGLSEYAQQGGARLGVQEITAGQQLIGATSPSAPSIVGSALLDRLADNLSSELKREGSWATLKLSAIFGFITVAAFVIGVRIVMMQDDARKDATQQPARDQTNSVGSVAAPSVPSAPVRDEIRRVVDLYARIPTLLGNALPHEAVEAAAQFPQLAERLDEMARKLIVDDRPADTVFRFWQDDVQTIATGWMLADGTSRNLVNTRIAEALRAAGDQPSSSDRLLAAFLTGAIVDPIDVWRNAWKTGQLVRIAAAPASASMPASVVQEAKRLADVVFAQHDPRPQSFEDGARAYLTELIPELIQKTEVDARSADSWELWFAAHRAIGAGEAHDRAMISALRAAMATSIDLSRAGPTTNLVGRLLSMMLERPTHIRREGVLSLFDDEAIDSRDLWVLTSFIALSDAATWFPDRLILREDADQRHWWRVRDEIAAAWPEPSIFEGTTFRAADGRPLQVDQTLASQWATALDEAVAEQGQQSHDAPSSLLTYLTRLIRMSRINEAAEALSVQSVDHVKLLLENLSSGRLNVPAAPQSPATLPQPARPDAEWANEYQQAGRTSDRRIDLLQSLRNAGRDLGPIDAAQFVREVYRGTPGEVRAVALELLQQFSIGPNVSMAMLDQFGDAAATDALSRALGEFTGTALPGPQSGGWKVAAKIALLEHAMSFYSDAGSEMDQLVAALSESYSVRLSLLRREPLSMIAAQSPQDLARSLAQFWQERAEQAMVSDPVPASLPDLQRRRATRFQLASGPMQRFVAHQLAVLELLTYITAAEQPNRRQLLESVIRRAALDRESLTDVLEQAVRIESTIAQVWRIRFGLQSETDSAMASPEISEREADGAPGRSLHASLATWQPRLEALSPADPMKYFELAEEIADASDSLPARQLARRLFALSAAIDPQQFGRSACMAIAHLLETDETRKRRWLALAALIGSPSMAPTALGADDGRSRDQSSYSQAAALALSDALGHYRRGEGAQAMASLRRNNAEELLHEIGHVFPGGAERILQEFQHYRGQSQPSLSPEMRMRMWRIELALLTPGDQPWSSDVLINQSQPLIEVDPARLTDVLGVDANRPYFRDGRWVAQ